MKWATGIGLGVLLFLIWEWNKVRELRDYNPLGVNKSERYAPDTSVLVTDENGNPVMDGPLYRFLTYEAGIAEAAHILNDLYFTRNGWNTPNLIAYHWTGHPKGAYTGKDIVAEMDDSNITPDTPLNFMTQGASLMNAIAINENGEAARMIPFSDYKEAVERELA